MERKETRKWRREIKEIRQLRLCGKRIHQHCDMNHDNRISSHEWNICLGVKKGKKKGEITFEIYEQLFNLYIFSEERRVQVNSRPIGKRRGPNPLKTWLKGD